MVRIVIDPVTRIEGHLKVETVVEDGVVKEARCSGMLFRGIEEILRGRDPRDAQQITQRICGVCPIAHALASSRALDDAFGATARIPQNGWLIRDLILGANYLQSHILHFYHLAALDYVDVAAAAGYAGDDARLRQVADFIGRGALAPFFPRYEGDYRLSKEANCAATAHYVDALDQRRHAHEMLAILGGKAPHNVGIFPGGALEKINLEDIAGFRWRLERIRDFIKHVYLPDVIAVARAYPDHFAIGTGCKRYLSYGAWQPTPRGKLGGNGGGFHLPSGVLDATAARVEPLDTDRIREHVRHSWYTSATDLPPTEGDTQADPRKEGAYSFVKAPRYNGATHEVGPLARILVAYHAGQPAVMREVDALLAVFDAGPEVLCSVLGRHAARAIETKLVADAMAEWVVALQPGEPACASSQCPDEAEGMGLAEAPRGALGHWIRIQKGVIANYQAIVPTTWNCSPRSDNGEPGACEQALEGVKVRDAENPFELVRIVRSFDPCLACAIHTVTPRGTAKGKIQVL